MIRRPPRSTLPTRRSSDLRSRAQAEGVIARHPGAVMVHLPTPDGDKAADHAADHSGTEQEPEYTQQLTVAGREDRKSTRLNYSHANISYAVFCLKQRKRRV